MWWLIALVLSAPPEVEVRPLSGDPIAGTLAELRGDQLTIETVRGPITLPFKSLLKVLSKSPASATATPQAWLELTDGSTLPGLSYRTAKGQAEFTLLDGQVVKLSTKTVATVRLKEQTDAIAAQWQQIVDSKRASDVIVIRQGEAIDFLEGVLGDAAEESIQFTHDGALSNVKRPRIEGLLYFHPAGNPLPSALCQLVDARGLRLKTAKVALTEGTVLATTTAGVEVRLPLESLAELDFSLGKLQYLSDLKPDSMQRTPYFGLPRGLDLDRYYDPKQNRAFDGGPLKLGSQTFSKGLAIKSRTRMVYRLPGKFSRFECLAGIDAGVAPLGSVQLVIRGDDVAKPLFEGLVRGKDAPLAISLDVANVKRLSIEVDFGEGGDIGDHLDLCEARVIQ